MSSQAVSIDYSGAANLVNRRRFLPLHAQHPHEISSPIAIQPPFPTNSGDSLERYDLFQDLIKITRAVNTVVVALNNRQLKLPLELMSFASLTSMDDELYRLWNLRPGGSMVGRRISIQAVWRITALMFISSICHLCQTHPLPSNDTLTELLHQEMLATMGDFSSIIPTLISCIAGYSKQHYSLATLAIHFALDDWRILGIKLLSFFSTHWICQGPIQDVWLRRLTSPLSV